MISNKTTALLGSLLLLAAAVPLTAAHLGENGSYTSGVLTDDYCRDGGTGAYTGPTASVDAAADLATDNFDAGCTHHDGVSGTYYGPAGAYIDSPTIFTTANPFVTGAMLCDAEVLGTGSSPSPQDEEKVDDADGGMVPDGTFDDGGQGGACHTQDHYENEGYDTPGCEGTAFAKDAVSGGDVWIGAACDWKATDTGPGLVTCAVNEVLGWNLSDPPSIIPGLADCASNFGDGGGTFQSCGSDGVADSIGYDHGTNGVTFVNGAAGDNCDPDTDPSAAVFVFEYVNEGDEENNPEVIPATAGWIDNFVAHIDP